MRWLPFSQSAKAIWQEFSYAGIRQVQWVPCIEDRDRDGFERAMRGEGYAGFEIRELAPSGQTARAARRPKYFPVQYARPFPPRLGLPGMEKIDYGADAHLGVDYGADAQGSAAMEQTKPPRIATATPWTTLPDGQALFRAFFPVYGGENLAGFIVAVIDVRFLICNAWPETGNPYLIMQPGMTHDFTLRLSDEGSSSSPPLDFVLRADLNKPRLSTATRLSVTAYREFSVATNRRWRLELRPRRD